ncbi:hypothetical protein CEK28_10305 [Xenophilus sp. AP218F]|nr:hypothetical protein CEK28_10305 [Xenophilus sp. AP218F]
MAKTILPYLAAYRFAVTMTVGLKMIASDLRFQSVGNLDLERKLEWQNGQAFLIKDESIKTLTLKRGLIAPGNAKDNPLEDATRQQITLWSERLVRTDLLINALDDKGQPKATWKVDGAVLRKIDWGGLDAGRNEILLEEMQFEYRVLRPFS